MALVNGFPFERVADNNWAVHMEGKLFYFATQQEAELVASIPLEIDKMYDNTPGTPDTDNIREIVRICRRDGITSFAIRRLQAWLDGQRSTQ